MLRIGLGLLFMAVMMAAAGCGSASRAGVSGSVSVNGQPLEAGDLSFSPVAPQGGPTAGAAIVRGKYKVPAEQGLLPGPYKVQIHAFRGTGKKTWDGMGEPSASASQKRYVEEIEQYIPARYNDATELKADVARGKTNEFKFDLQVPAAGRGK